MVAGFRDSKSCNPPALSSYRPMKGGFMRRSRSCTETAVRERPIPLSAYWILAYLAGRKTQTRRVVFKNGEDGGLMPTCPHGKPGDSLWFREAWRTVARWDHLNGSQIAELCNIGDGLGPWAPLQYEADLAKKYWDALEQPGRLRCSRFMPRWASRITTPITGVRIERLQEITEAGAMLEGIAPGPTWRKSWIRGWDEINAERGYPWKSNPSVWVVTFVGRQRLDEANRAGSGRNNLLRRQQLEPRC
jgi:hypothetical protein